MNYFPQTAGIQWGSSTGFPMACFGGHLFNLTRLFTGPPSRHHNHNAHNTHIIQYGIIHAYRHIADIFFIIEYSIRVQAQARPVLWCVAKSLNLKHMFTRDIHARSTHVHARKIMTLSLADKPYTTYTRAWASAGIILRPSAIPSTNSFFSWISFCHSSSCLGVPFPCLQN